MQEIKRQILSTGPLPEALVMEAAAENIVIETASFIEIMPVIDDTTAAQIGELFQMPITAVFTSSNAVNAVATLFQKPMPWNVYSIGNTTAKAITQLFQTPISGTANDAATLADVIKKDGINGVYFFCGAMRRDELPEKLRTANISVTELVVYKTVETPRSVSINYDAVLFYSPSAVHSFFSVNTISHHTILFAIGHTTAAAIQQHSNNALVVAQKPDKEMLVRQVIAHFNTTKEKTE